MSVIKLPSARWVRIAVRDLIRTNSAHINARMADVDLGNSTAPTLQRISHSYRRQNNIDRNSFPAFHIEQRQSENEWKAMPNIGKSRYKFNIWGLLVWDEPEQAEDLVAEYAAGVADVLNQRHIPIPISNGYFMYFDDVMPLTGIEFGAIEFSNAIVHGFTAVYTCDVDYSAPDTSAQSRI